MREDDDTTFAGLKTPAVEALARILYMKNATATARAASACDPWLASQRRQVAQLHEASLRRRGTLSLMADVFIRGAFAAPGDRARAEETALLCRSHRELNPAVLAALMTLVADETTSCVDRFRHFRERERRRRRRLAEGSSSTSGVSPEQAEERGVLDATVCWLDSIAQVAALWMGKTAWEDEMRRPLPVHLPSCARHRACTACKLAVVGGSPQFLMDLRASLLSRRQYAIEVRGEDDGSEVGGLAAAAAAAGKGAKEPLLLRMVEAWIDMCYPEAKRRFIRRESDVLVPLVVGLREWTSSKRSKRVWGTAGRKGGKDGRRYTKRGWPMPLKRPTEAELAEAESAIAGGGDDDEDDEDEDGDDGSDAEICDRRGGDGAFLKYRKKNRAKKQGYSHHLPKNLAPSLADYHQQDDGLYRTAAWQTMNAKLSATTNDKNVAARGCATPPWAADNGYNPPDFAAGSPARLRGHAGLDRTAPPEDAADYSGEPEPEPEPWDADYERYIFSSQSLCSEANVSAIYGLYLDSEGEDDADTISPGSSISAVRTRHDGNSNDNGNSSRTGKGSIRRSQSSRQTSSIPPPSVFSHEAPQQPVSPLSTAPSTPSRHGGGCGPRETNSQRRRAGRANPFSTGSSRLPVSPPSTAPSTTGRFDRAPYDVKTQPQQQQQHAPQTGVVPSGGGRRPVSPLSSVPSARGRYGQVPLRSKPLPPTPLEQQQQQQQGQPRPTSSVYSQASLVPPPLFSKKKTPRSGIPLPTMGADARAGQAKVGQPRTAARDHQASLAPPPLLSKKKPRSGIPLPSMGADATPESAKVGQPRTAGGNIAESVYSVSSTALMGNGGNPPCF